MRARMPSEPSACLLISWWAAIASMMAFIRPGTVSDLDVRGVWVRMDAYDNQDAPACINQVERCGTR